MCFEKYSNILISSGALQGVASFFIAWFDVKSISVMWRKLYLIGHLGLHRLNCHFHANRLLEAELNWRQKTFRVCLRHHKYEYWCLFMWLFLLREKTRAIIYLVKTLLKRMNWMLGLFCDTFCILEVNTLSAVVSLCAFLAPRLLAWTWPVEPVLQELWLCTEPGEWGGLSLGNLSQKTIREAVHTFCRRFHLSPLLCSVRIQQCQLCDICHPLSWGIVELESKKHILRDSWVLEH